MVLSSVLRDLSTTRLTFCFLLFNMQEKISGLSGAALNWAVNYALHGRQPLDYVEVRDNYSTCWNKGGPIIEREGILLRPARKQGHGMDGKWLAMYDGTNTGSIVRWTKREDFIRYYWTGDTPLIAAMRCFVGSKLGDTIEIPDELTNG